MLYIGLDLIFVKARFEGKNLQPIHLNYMYVLGLSICMVWHVIKIYFSAVYTCLVCHVISITLMLQEWDLVVYWCQWGGYSLHIKTIVISQNNSSNIWFGVVGYCSRIEDMEMVLVWRNFSNLYQPQKSKIYSYSKGFEFETTKMDRTFEGLWLHHWLSSREMQM